MKNFVFLLFVTLQTTMLSFAMHNPNLKRKRQQCTQQPSPQFVITSLVSARIPTSKKRRRIMNKQEQEQFIQFLTSNSNVDKMDVWLQGFEVDFDAPLYRNSRPLDIAAQKGYCGLVEYLVVVKNATKYSTAFSEAVNHKHAAVVLFLAEKFSINVNTPIDSQNRKTPLHVAFDKKCLPLIKVLINKLDAGIDFFDIEGFTPIASLAKVDISLKCADKIFEYLFGDNQRHPVNSSVSVNGSTLLHEAARSGNINVIKELVEKYNATVFIFDIDEKTPLDYAQNEEIKGYFSEKMRLNTSV